MIFLKIIRLFVPEKAGFVRTEQTVMLLKLDRSCGAVYSGDLAGEYGAFCSPPFSKGEFFKNKRTSDNCLNGTKSQMIIF